MQVRSLSRLKLVFALSVLMGPVGLATGCAHTAAPSASEAAPAREPMLRHVVLFKFKDTALPEQIQVIERMFAELPSKIPAIVDFEWGTDVGVEDKANGFTHAFLLTFADEGGRDSYLPHPEHQAFVAVLKPQLEKLLVIDYWTRR